MAAYSVKMTKKVSYCQYSIVAKGQWWILNVWYKYIVNCFNIYNLFYGLKHNILLQILMEDVHILYNDF